MPEHESAPTAVTQTTATATGGHRLLVLVDGRALVLPLAEGRPLTVGRSSESELHVDHVSVSRRHAEIEVRDAIRVRDLESANGTKIGGRALEPRTWTRIEPGTLFEVGSVRAVVMAPADQGASAIEKVRELVARIAPSPITVLLVGETGVGKEVVAREIHRLSDRAAKPFLAVNCAAVPENLLESELFGYEKGAFTGATERKPGLFSLADRGTLLLDEIGDMPLATQAKLLRVLETRTVSPLGALRSTPIDVRFIAATHRDPATMSQNGTFREDLFFRLAGVVVEIPPLRARRTEIAALASELLAEACLRAGKAPRHLSSDALLLVQSYSWPGNVRELRAAMELAAVLARGDVVTLDDLRLGRLGASPPAPEKSARAEPVPANDERAAIERALAATAGNQKEAAKVLGITRRALGLRIERLGIARPRKR